MWRNVIALLMLSTVGRPGHAAEAPILGPQSTAQQLREARGDLRAPAHKITLDVTREGETTRERVVVVVSRNALEVSRGSTDQLYDFKLRRVLSINRAARSFANVSLYANLAARTYEAQNRAFLLGALGAAKVTVRPESLDPFWVASELGVPMPNQAPAKIERQSGPNGAMSFTYGGAEVARAVSSQMRLPPDEQARFASFLRVESSLHPDIVDIVVATDRIPQTLVVDRIFGDKHVRMTYQLVSVEPAEFLYPLPTDYRTDPLPKNSKDGAGEAMRPLLPTMLDAVARRYGGGPRPASDYELAIDHALAGRQGFAALLLVLELQLQHGLPAANCQIKPAPAPCHPLAEIGAAVRADPRVQSLTEAMRVEQADHDPAKAILIRQSIRRDDVANGYVVEDQLANAMSAKGMLGNDTFALFADAVRGNPYVSTFYKDLGDYFMRQYRADLAWLCYDLGRALPDADATPVLKSITALEQQLAANFTRFF